MRRLLDYQDADYAELYLTRLRRLAGAGLADEALAEAARHLALWMAYQDIIRVAQLKSRASRFARLRAEVRAKQDEPVRVTEFFKPGIEEVSALLPPSLGGALYRWAERRNLLHRLHLPMHVTTTNVSGFLRLWLLARLRRWRRRGYRFAAEQALIERWLDAIGRAQRIAPSMSFSTSPRPRIFSRTAFSLSPGVLITTGLKTTSPSLRETSKYSASGSCRTIAFGSVT